MRCYQYHQWEDCSCGPIVGARVSGTRLTAAVLGAAFAIFVAVAVLGGSGMLP